MYYFVTYIKKTGVITGFFRQSTKEFLPEPPSSEEDYVEITGPSYIKALENMDPRQERIEGNVKRKKIQDFKITPRFQGRIELTTEAVDRDGDGLPELPADGKSATRVKAHIKDLRGRACKKETVAVRFQVSRGAIAQRMVESRSGVAEVAFTAAAETTEAQVMAFADGYEGDALIFEFIPVEEYRMLTTPRRKNKG